MKTLYLKAADIPFAEYIGGSFGIHNTKRNHLNEE